MKFHNPYAFIEATGKVNSASAKTVSFTDIANGKDPYVRHDRWHRDAVSGRMVFCLETQSPTVIGKEQMPDDSEASEVKPYTVRGEVAIPGSSLRGLIGSNVETLSQSALRVMSDKTYSVRQGIGKTPVALGMLVKSDKMASGWGIRPLVVPALASNYSRFRLDREWQSIFGQRIVWRDHLAVYLNGYNKYSAEKKGFIKHRNPQSYTPENKEYWYANLSRPERSSEEIDSANTPHLKIKPPQNRDRKGNSYLIGQQFTTNSERAIISQAEYDSLSHSEQQQYTRGIVRILGREHDAIPNNKIHELFIPYPESAEQRELLPVDKQVVENFIAIAKERHEDESHLPFRLRGHVGKCYQLDDGDLLYFGIDSNSKVKQLSVSQNWRQAVKGSTYDAFGNMSADLLPLTKQRDALTVAECLFGAVAENKEEGERQALHLASRVRFHDAKAFDQVKLMDQSMLRILASPKAPSPSMYFHHANQPRRAITKQQLDLSSPSHRPNGRKRYVPHRQQDIDDQFWNTKEGNDLHLRLKVQPIPAGQRFYFHVDFENISLAELSLLRAAITPEQFDSDFSGAYQHRLGLGKPLGLGHVTIKPLGVFLIDRNARYLPTGLLKPRYHRSWINEALEWPESVKRQYRLEGLSKGNQEVRGIPEYQDTYVDASTLEQMLTLGDSKKVQHRVRYPFVDEHYDAEQEGFKWFDANDKSRHRVQVLPSTRNVLPSLDSTGNNNNDRKPRSSAGNYASSNVSRQAASTPDAQGFVRGKVKFFSEEEGYGFIIVEGSPDVYISRWILKQCGFKNITLITGDVVLIKSGPGKKSLEVKALKLVTEQA